MFNWGKALGLSLSSLVACGSSNSHSTLPQVTDGGGDAAASYAVFCANNAQVTCNAIASCCSMTVDACRTSEEAICLESESDFSVAGVEFNSASAEACISGLPTLISACAYVPTSSPNYQAVLLACRSLTVGTLPMSSECKSSGQCAGTDVSCISDSSGVKRCTAIPPSNEGGPCGGAALASCATGLYCDSSKAPSHCAPLKADGATCQHATECISSTCTNSTCVEPTIDTFCQSLRS